MRLGGDIAILSWMKGEQPDRVFSAKHSCPECDRAVAELEPRLFSFNNPFGAPALFVMVYKTRSHFSADKLIPNNELSISEGAIRIGIKSTSVLLHSMLQKVADHYQFSLETPWKGSRC